MQPAGKYFRMKRPIKFYIACWKIFLSSENILLTARCTIVQSMSAVRPSVCPSVMLVDQDQISWKSWKLIARTISPISSLFRSPKAISTYSQGKMGTFGGDYEVGGEKWRAGAQKRQYLRNA